MTEPEHSRRILLVAYYFGSPGATVAFRWNAMTRDLTALGWSVDVLTWDPAGPDGRKMSDPDTPESKGITVHRIAEPRWPASALEAGVQVIRQFRDLLRWPRTGVIPPLTRSSPPGPENGPENRPRSGTPASSVSRRIRSGARLCAHLGWTWRAIRAGQRLGRRHRYRAVVVSTPPHAAQLAGAKLSATLDSPYVADYRDPWVFGIPRPPYVLNPLQRMLGMLFERPTMERAVVVICNTERAAAAVRREYSSRDIVTIAVPNGYDALPSVDQPDPDRFRIVYAGSLYPYHDLSALFAACARLGRRTGLTPPQLRIELMGADLSGGDDSPVGLARRYDLEEHLCVYPHSSRDEALKLQQAAAVLVIFDHFHGLAVPTKFYDCAQMFGSLLLFGTAESALSDAAARVGVQVCDPADSVAIDSVLNRALERWRAYSYEWPTDRHGIFERSHQSRRVHEILAVLDRRTAFPGAAINLRAEDASASSP